MAGTSPPSLEIIPVASATTTTASAVVGEPWEVEFSRFFFFPSLSSTITTTTTTHLHHHPALLPLTPPIRSRLRGTWLSSSTSSSSAFLKLSADFSKSDFVLTVTFLGKIQEEHYISKLNFSWPQVSCMSGFPARGSRVVFASYQDSAGLIQKFALRFSAPSEVDAFMTTLKELMAVPQNFGDQYDNLVSEISSQSDFIPYEEAAYRPQEDWNAADNIYASSHQLVSSLYSEVAQNSVSPQTSVLNHNVGSDLEGLPPSFTSLMMMSSQPVVEEGKTSVTDQAELKRQMMRYLDDSSFQDILGTVEKVMHEIGADLAL